MRTPLWNAYTLLLGVFSGLSAAIGTAAGILYLVLVWFFGDPDPSRASRFFEPAPALVAAIVLGQQFIGKLRKRVGNCLSRAAEHLLLAFTKRGFGFAHELATSPGQYQRQQTDQQ